MSINTDFLHSIIILLLFVSVTSGDRWGPAEEQIAVSSNSKFKLTLIPGDNLKKNLPTITLEKIDYSGSTIIYTKVAVNEISPVYIYVSDLGYAPYH